MERIQITAPKSWLDDLDEMAKERNMNRSEYVREAVRRQMQRDIAEGVVNDEL